jgi:hypothetical protein
VDPDVVVKRCRLTLRGRGGWGWGADPARYLEVALPAVEGAILRCLHEAGLPDGVPVHLVEPVRLRWHRDGTLTDASRAAFVDALRAQLPAPEPPPDAPRPGRGHRTGRAAGADRGGRQPPPGAGPELAAVLGRWSRSGRLPRIVRSWPAAAARRWVELLGAEAELAGGAGADIAETAVASIADAVLAPAQTGSLRGHDRLLVLLGALVSTAGDRVPSAATVRRAARLAGAARPADGLAGEPAPPAAVRQPPAPGPEGPPAATGAGTGAPATGLPAELPDRLVAPALPFLVVVQLGRIGYLDALWAAGTAAGPDTGRVLAAGLAGKTLPPPDRGWRRSDAEASAVAAVSGLGPDAWGAGAARLLGGDDLVEAPLRSALVALYADGRASCDEIVVTATADGLVCGEAAGALPIAWVSSRDELDQVLDQLGRPPARDSDLFEPLAADLDARRAFPHLALPGLERHLGVAVASALGSLATELWGQVPDAPRLALRRLGDLEGEVRIGDRLELAIPRGQRWLDLRRCGLLNRWPVPWAPGGSWELVTW